MVTIAKFPYLQQQSLWWQMGKHRGPELAPGRSSKEPVLGCSCSCSFGKKVGRRCWLLVKSKVQIL